MHHWKISRRTALRGLGTAVALPLLDSMIPTLCRASAPQVANGLPKRMAFIFVPNGVHPSEWTPKRDGYRYDLPAVLEPLGSFRDEVSVLSGLTHDKGRNNGDGPGDHARSASVFLTGAQPRKTSGGNIRSGISVDQVAAKKIGHLTRFPSLELGCEDGRNAGNCDSGYGCAYSHNISWASATTPLAKETDPRLVFERLFADQSAQAHEAQGKRAFFRQSILDFVSDDAKRLQSKLGVRDQQKLDEYLTAVRSIERRIESSEQLNREERDKSSVAPRSNVRGPSVRGPSDARDESNRLPSTAVKPNGIPENFGEHVRLMEDMMVLAFQTDLTRVATCMFGRAGSNRSYRMIDVPDGHHDLSHHGGEAAKLEKILKINRYHMEQFAYFLQRLKSIPEGEGTLLDNCLILYGSGLGDGNRHNHDNLPVLLAGRGGGSIRPGRHIRYAPETPMANLFMTMLDHVGAGIPEIGDSTGLLHGLG